MPLKYARPVVRANTARASVGVLVIASWLAPRVALGSPTEAESALTQGVASFKHHDYEAARVAFQRSYDLNPRTSTLLNLALAELNSDHPLAAVKHLRAFVRAPDAPLAKVEDVRANVLPRAEAQIGRLQIDAPSGTRISLDGVSLGSAPFSETADVLPGMHEIAAVFDDGRSSRTTISVTAGELFLAHILVVAPVAPPTAAPIGHSTPTADVPAAPHGTTAKKITVIALGAGAVAALAVGTAFYIASKSNESDADGYRAGLGLSACAPPAGQPVPPNCALLRDANSAQSTHESLATGFYVGGAGLAVGAVVAWLLWPKPPAVEDHAWVQPMVGRSPGVAFGASF